MRKRFDFAQNTLAFGVFNTRSEQLCKEKKDNHTRTGSPPLPLADEVTAAAAHAGRFRRAPAPHSTAPSSPCSAPPSPPARFSSPGLYRPLATTPPWLRFRAVLRRRVSGGPRSLKEKHFSYAPESGVRYDGVYSLRTVGGRLVFSGGSQIHRCKDRYNWASHYFFPELAPLAALPTECHPAASSHPPPGTSPPAPRPVHPQCLSLSRRHWPVGTEAESRMVMVPRRTLERRLIASLLPYPWSGAAPTTLRWRLDLQKKLQCIED
ncbi:uncharacterized protein LOC125551393 isoform X3 [Triticum urartu]|uniref:uncharacterized protein LOC125551393 isoform X3 n=1 Tax=Triticum urartu TaxID=4572 RepID=UPI0020443741|nr:uncharacterized protein LOC125551393 isoform X3 [Triticum urartu]